MIIATLISPPEFISHISVAIPLIFIYEISVLVSKMVFRRRQRHQELEYLDEDNLLNKA